jgi:hypothetical protein
MTAIEVFYQCLSAGKLPAAVPISEDGGLGTVAFDLSLRPAAQAVAHHEDAQDRALIAIYACQAAHEAVESVISK